MKKKSEKRKSEKRKTTGILIKNGRVLNPATGMDQKAHVLIEGDTIKGIFSHTEKEWENSRADEETEEIEVIEAEGMVVAPGLVDVHVHFREPGFTHKEDIASGARAAAKGGFTTVVLMANTHPAVDNLQTLDYVLEKGKKTGIRIESCANVTVGMQGKELVDMAALAAAGAVGFTDDGLPLLDEAIVREAMKQALKAGKPISFHEEDPALIGNNGIHRGKASAYYGLAGSPREAEIAMVRRDLALAAETGAVVSIQHISTKEAVELVRQAKAAGNPVFAEATPHHFTLTEEAVIGKGTLAKMNPPLRTEEDRLAIIRGLQDGTIDMIATDHAPHSKAEKEKNITEAPSGIIGLETALSLGIRELVEKGYLTLLALIERMSTAPARLYQLPGGKLETGRKADLVLFYPEKTWVVEGFASKSSNSPFLGETLPGVVFAAICDGKVVYQRTESVPRSNQNKTETDEIR